MLISRNWLLDFVDISDLSKDEYSDLITTKVAEVDDVISLALPLDSAVVATILKVEAHPKKASLKLVKLGAGGSEASVVCGAPNCEVGQTVAFLPPGSLAYKPIDGREEFKVECAEVHGVSSEGILASEAELGLTGDHQGLFIIEDSGVSPGASLADVCGSSDIILEIDNKSLTHRPDLWSHYGFARELAAVLGRELKIQVDAWSDASSEGEVLLKTLGSTPSSFSITIDKSSECRRFSAIEVKGISNQKSPLWLRRRLYSVGAGTRNLLVDLSNYVMFDVGQPNHVYDISRLTGDKLFVRNARSKEKFTGLDDVERELSVKDVVIADAKEPVALGGVIGGRDSAVSESTSHILLESANFCPVRVRQTTKRHQTRTDASNRFEKSLSAFATPLALVRYSNLLKEIDSAAEIASTITEDFPTRPDSVRVSLSNDFVRRRLGADIPDERIEGILTSLGFELELKGKSESSEGNYEVSIPYYRATRDIDSPEDLVEEVGRIYGYENIPETVPWIASAPTACDPLRAYEDEIRAALSGNGLHEIYQYSFANDGLTEQCGFSVDSALELKNTVSSEQRFLRTSLVPGIISASKDNSRFNSEFGLFEIGRCYEKARGEDSQSPADEARRLGISLFSKTRDDACRSSLGLSTDGGNLFYTLLSLVKRVVRINTAEALSVFPVADSNTDRNKMQGPVGASSTFGATKWMHLGRAVCLQIGTTVCGVIAEVNPQIFGGKDGRMVISELDLSMLLGANFRGDSFCPVSKFPVSLFEMSVVMPKNEPYMALEQLLRRSDSGSLIRSIEAVSVYEGAPLAESEKSISVRMSLGRSDGTLSSEELTQAQDSLIGTLKGGNYSLRS